MASPNTIGIFGLNQGAWDKTYPGLKLIPAVQTPILDLAAERLIAGIAGQQYSWTENNRKQNSKVTANVGSGAGDTSIPTTASETGFFAVGDVLMGVTQLGAGTQADTNEKMLVTAVNVATDTVTVQRGYLTTTRVALATATNDGVRRLFSSVASDANTYSRTVLQQIVRANYFQGIFRTLALLARYLQTDVLGNKQIAVAIQGAIAEVLEDLERALVIGKALSASPQGGAGIYPAMDGLIEAYVKGGNPAFTTVVINSELTFLQYLEASYKFNKGNNLLICGTTAIRNIYDYTDTRIQYVGDDPTRGARVATYDSSYGIYRLIVSELIGASDVYALMDSDLVLVTNNPADDPVQVEVLAKPDAGADWKVGGFYTLMYVGASRWLKATTAPVPP